MHLLLTKILKDKKTTSVDFERNRAEKTKRWLGWLSFCMILFFGPFTFVYGQGNTCVNPLTVTSLPYSHTGNTSNYGNDYTQTNVPAVAVGAVTNGTGAVNYLNGFEVVYSITPIINGQITITTTNDAGWMALWAFSGCPFSSTVGYHTATDGATRAINNLPVVANTTYYIVFSSWYEPGVNYTINVTGTSGLLTPLTACTGAPTGGTASITPNGGNAGAAFTASATGVTLASGLAYQWQKNIGGTWQDIAGATAINSSITAEAGAVGTATDYRLKVTCTALDLTSYSTTATYTISLVYCPSVPTSNDNSGITNVTLGTSNFPVADVTYYNHPNTVNLIAGISNQALITFATGYGYGTNIWIDLNDNGTFESTELLFQGESANANPTTFNASFSIDAAAPLGLHKMRIGTADSGQATPNPCYSGSYGVTIDVMVNIFAPPACLPPSALTALNVTSNSAELSWSSTGTLFDIEWGLQGFTQGTGTPPVVMGVSLPYTLSLPSPSTSYSYYVRQDCGATGGVSFWSGPYSFKTACAPVDAFTENFDSYTATGAPNPLPSCWSRLGNTGNSYITTGSGAPMSGTKRLLLGGSATTSTNGVAVMPQVSNLQAGTHRLKFTAYSSAAGKLLTIGYYESSNDPTNFVDLETFEMPSTTLSTATEFVYNAPQFIPNGVQSLAFKVEGGAFTGTTTIYIDDVIWEPIPSCADVIEIELSNITANAVDVIWTTDGSESAWQYVYAASTVTDPSTLTPIAVNNNPYLSLTDLAPNTSYNLWIRSNCGSGALGNWSTVQTFTTACAPVTTFTEDFDSSATGSTNPLPSCWIRAGNGSTYVQTGGALPGTPPNRLYMYASGTLTTPTEAIAIMPAVSNLADGTHRLKFRAYASAANKTIEIGYYSDPSDMTTYIPLQVIDLLTTTAATAAVYTYIPVGVPSGITTLAFKNAGLPASTTVYIDDVVWEAQPLCPDVNTVHFDGATSNTASISWNAGGAETAWEYVYGLATVTDPTTLTAYPVTGVPQAVITGLLPSTTYKVWVRSTCGTNLGAFSSPTTFITACEAIVTLPWTEGFEGVTTVGTNAFPPCWFEENGDWTTAVTSTRNTPHTGVNYLRNSYSATNEYMWTPGFEMTAGTSYDFSFYMQGDGYPDWTIDLFYNTQQLSTDATPIGNSFSPIITGATSTIQDYQQILNTFVPPTSGVYYFAIRVNVNGTPWYVAFDDFKLELSPNCVAPVVSAATNISTETATINWEAPFNAPAVGYDYYITTNETLPTAATVPTGNVAAGITTKDLVGLTSATLYRFYVRGVCGTTETSAWSQAGSFTTLCDAAALPYTIDFESVTVPNLPLCTFNQNVGTGNDWKTYSGTNSGFTGKFLRYSYSGSNAANTWFFTNVFNLVAGTSYTVSYKYGAGSTSYSEKLKVAYGNAANDAAMTTILADHTNVNFNVPQYNSVEFTPTASGLHVIGFNAYSAANLLYLQVDDIVIMVTPTCVPPAVAPTVTNITANTATLNWTASSTPAAEGYDYYYSTSTTNPTAATTPSGSVLAGVTTAELSSLTPVTAYYVWVRSKCSTTDVSAWSYSATFTTPCSSYDAPFSEDFTTFLPSCWSRASAGTVATGPTNTLAGSWLADGFLNVGTTGAARFNLYSTNRIGWLITPILNTTVGVNYAFTFDYGVTAYTGDAQIAMGSDDSVKIAMSTDNGTTWTEIQNFTNASNITNTTQEYLYSFVATTGTVKFAFIGTDGTVNDLEDYNFYIDNVNFDTALSNSTFDKNVFTVYPNPVKNNLTIRYNENIIDATVYNLMGQQLFTKNINATEGQIDMSNLATGTYLVKVTSGDKVQTMKVIKQ